MISSVNPEVESKPKPEIVGKLAEEVKEPAPRKKRPKSPPPEKVEVTSFQSKPANEQEQQSLHTDRGPESSANAKESGKVIRRSGRSGSGKRNSAGVA